MRLHDAAFIRLEAEREAKVKAMESEIARLRLTDEEREAIRLGQRLLREAYAERLNSDFVAAAAVIDGILARF